jgi:hypothetical protein
MKIPKTFELAGSTWTVELVPNFTMLGQCSRDDRLIFLRENMLPEHQEQAFFHELTHAIKYMQGETEHNEQQVDGFATYLHQFFKTVKYK